jgi:hypothetical protein
MLLRHIWFSHCSEVDASEKESLQDKVKDAQTQLQVAKETLLQYREKENQMRADEVSMGKHLVCATPHAGVI